MRRLLCILQLWFFYGTCQKEYNKNDIYNRINDFRSDNRAYSYIPLNKYPFLSSYPQSNFHDPPFIYPNLPPNYLPPSTNYPLQGLPYCIPFISPTHDICPDKFYFFEYEPLLYESEDIADSFTPSDSTISETIKESSTTKPEKQSSSSQTKYSLRGPVWDIFKQTYDKCCPLNRKSLKTNQVDNEFELYQKLFNSFGVLNNSIQGQGIYGLIEYNNPFQQNDMNKFSIQILSSSGKFYIHTKLTKLK
jgi:hypothetical protein